MLGEYKLSNHITLMECDRFLRGDLLPRSLLLEVTVGVVRGIHSPLLQRWSMLKVAWIYGRLTATSSCLGIIQ